jgi:hypothetical protein
VTEWLLIMKNLLHDNTFYPLTILFLHPYFTTVNRNTIFKPELDVIELYFCVIYKFELKFCVLVVDNHLLSSLIFAS